MLLLQDVGGDEDWHLYAQAVDSSSLSRDLTPFKVGLQQLQVQQRRTSGSSSSSWCAAVA